jgi:hypothetical protein
MSARLTCASPAKRANAAPQDLLFTVPSPPDINGPGISTFEIEPLFSNIQRRAKGSQQCSSERTKASRANHSNQNYPSQIFPGRMSDHEAQVAQLIKSFSMQKKLQQTATFTAGASVSAT